MSDAMERIVKVTPSWDKRSDIPTENYGIGQCKVFFILRGPLGAVQFVVGTNWYVQSAREHLEGIGGIAGYDDTRRPFAYDLGYHSPHPMYKEQSSMECDLIESGRCYYDGSTLNAERWVDGFIEGGTDWLWPKLERYYNDVFSADEDAA